MLTPLTHTALHHLNSSSFLVDPPDVFPVSRHRLLGENRQSVGLAVHRGGVLQGPAVGGAQRSARRAVPLRQQQEHEALEGTCVLSPVTLGGCDPLPALL